MPATRTPGVIRADEAYTLTEFRKRTGLGSTAFRGARAAGLRVIALGRKRYVLGVDWIEFLKQVQVQEKSSGEQE